MEIDYEPPVPSTSTIQPTLLSQPRADQPDSEDEENEDVENDVGDEEGEGDGDDEPEEGDDGEEEEQEEGEGEGAEDTAAAAKPAKRFPKQRQSLAEKQPGTTIFPISRVKRIVKADKELDTMTSEATFLVAVATEYFIKHFMEEGYTKARLDKRKIVNYRDMANVVARSHEFDFLRDVIPAPMAMSDALELRKRKMAIDENPTLHEDTPASAQEITENLPPLIPSTNPLFPNAVVKKPPNTHAKTAQGGGGKGKKGAAAAAAAAAAAGDVEEVESAAPVATPVKANGKTSASTPHSQSTRKSARRSIVLPEAPDLEMDAPPAPSSGEVLEAPEPNSEPSNDRMDED